MRAATGGLQTALTERISVFQDLSITLNTTLEKNQVMEMNLKTYEKAFQELKVLFSLKKAELLEMKTRRESTAAEAAKEKQNLTSQLQLEALCEAQTKLETQLSETQTKHEAEVEQLAVCMSDLTQTKFLFRQMTGERDEARGEFYTTKSELHSTSFALKETQEKLATSQAALEVASFELASVRGLYSIALKDLKNATEALEPTQEKLRGVTEELRATTDAKNRATFELDHTKRRLDISRSELDAKTKRLD